MGINGELPAAAVSFVACLRCLQHLDKRRPLILTGMYGHTTVYDEGTRCFYVFGGYRYEPPWGAEKHTTTHYGARVVLSNELHALCRPPATPGTTLTHELWTWHLLESKSVRFALLLCTVRVLSFRLHCSTHFTNPIIGFSKKIDFVLCGLARVRVREHFMLLSRSLSTCWLLEARPESKNIRMKHMPTCFAASIGSTSLTRILFLILLWVRVITDGWGLLIVGCVLSTPHQSTLLLLLQYTTVRVQYLHYRSMYEYSTHIRTSVFFSRCCLTLASSQSRDCARVDRR